MKEFAASKLVSISGSLEFLEKIYLCYAPRPKEYNPTQKARIVSSLKSILEDLDFLSLRVTKAQCERVIADIEEIPLTQLQEKSATLRGILYDELKTKSLFLLPPDNLKQFHK
jgi:hypothetical protein